jgi:hypothetical protein
MRFCQANLLQNAAFQKAKGSVRLHAHTLQLPTSSKQGACTSTKRKTPEVEEIDLTISTTGARPFDLLAKNSSNQLPGRLLQRSQGSSRQHLMPRSMKLSLW